MPPTPPAVDADQAKDFALRWADRLEPYAGVRMEELGIPSDMIGSSDDKRGVAWRALVGETVRKMLRAIRLSEQEFRGGGPSRIR